MRVLAELEEQLDMDREENEAELQGAHSETQVTQPTKTVFQSNKRLKADVWKEYIPVGVGIDGKNRGRCIYCCKELVIEVKNGTSSLKRHLEICPVKPESDGNAERKYDHKVNREMTSELIIYHDLPFRYVEYEKVRARDKYLNPKCVPICRQTAAADVFRKYEMEKAKLKRLFANLKSRVCFTTDLWSARTVMGYICLTAHYIDDGWTLNNKILAFCEIKPPHTGDEIAKKVLGCLKEWGLEKKVLRKYADCDDEDLRLMARRMQIKFAKYWDDYSIVLAMGAMLDPRFKTQILKKAFDRLDPTTSEKKVEVIVQNLKDLYEEYTSKPVTGSSSSSNYSSTPDDLLNESPLDDDLNAVRLLNLLLFLS